NPYTSICGGGFHHRGGESRRATVLSSYYDFVVQCAHWIIRRYVPGSVPHPRRIGQGDCTAANRPSCDHLFPMRQYHFYVRTIFVRDALTGGGIQDFKANDKPHAAFENPALNTRHCWLETILARPVTR